MNAILNPAGFERVKMTVRQKMMKKWITIVAASTVALYVLFPAVAGALKIGRLDGPAIYPKSYLMLVFRIGYSLAGHGKPRVSHDVFFMRRPPFYGFSATLISEAEASQLFAFQEANSPPETVAKLRSRYEELKRRTAEPDFAPYR